jgi:hypothetical protein
VPLVRASRTPLASKYLRNASFLDSLAYTNPATTYPQKQTPAPVRTNPVLPALLTQHKQTNKQTNKIGNPETHGSHNYPLKATISRNSTTYHHSHHPIHRFNSPPTVPFLPLAKKKEKLKNQRKKQSHSSSV